MKKHLKSNYPKNTCRENTFTKNTSSKNVTKCTLRTRLIVILGSVFSIFNT